MKRRIARTIIPILTALVCAALYLLAQWQPDWLAGILTSFQSDANSLGGEFYGFEWYQFFYLLGLGVLIAGVCVRAVASLTEKSVFSFSFWMAALVPVALSVSGLLFLIFLQSTITRAILTITVVFLVWLFMKLLYYYFHDRVHYQAHAIENISNYLQVTIIFLLTTGFYNVFLFAQGGFWKWYGWLGAVLAIVIGLLTIQLFWVSDIVIRKYWPYIAIIVLLVFEVFTVMRLLPTSVYVNSIMVAIVYYASTGLVRNAIRGSLTSSVVRRYVTVSVVVGIIILATAKWF